MHQAWEQYNHFHLWSELIQSPREDAQTVKYSSTVDVEEEAVLEKTQLSHRHRCIFFSSRLNLMLCLNCGKFSCITYVSLKITCIFDCWGSVLLMSIRFHSTFYLLNDFVLWLILQLTGVLKSPTFTHSPDHPVNFCCECLKLFKYIQV